MDGTEPQRRCPSCERLEREVAALTERLARVEGLLEEARRAGKRQAAPFRKKAPKADPKRPGRKAGEDHGGHHRRAVPERVDETHEAPLPECCPGCGERRLNETGVAAQYQTDFVVRPVTRRFNVHVGVCGGCGRRVQGRHQLQTSDALGAAAVQLGANAHAALALLNKEFGLSHGKAARLLKMLLGVELARGTSARSVRRTAGRLAAAHGQVRAAVRGSPQVTPDETGWRVGGHTAWLHAFAAAGATCYAIDPTRSANPLADLIGWDWPGVLVHDGWAAYDRFAQAQHQHCQAHQLRRCGELLQAATAGAVRFPRAVKALLRQALSVRDRHAAGELSARGRSVLRGKLGAALGRLVRPLKRHAGNETLAAFLERHLESLFTFLKADGVDATNWRAEQAIRPAVVNRKVWGGNRTWAGAADQAVLMSVLRTCHQQAIAPFQLLTQALHSTTPILLPLTTR
jgi:transposase